MQINFRTDTTCLRIFIFDFDFILPLKEKDCQWYNSMFLLLFFRTTPIDSSDLIEKGSNKSNVEKLLQRQNELLEQMLQQQQMINNSLLQI